MKTNWKPIYQAVRTALREYWDPLPETPDDEYDGFALGITSLICNGHGTVDQISEYLLDVELNRLEIAGEEANAVQYHAVSKNILEFVRNNTLKGN